MSGYGIAAIQASAKSLIAREALGFVRAGKLFLERPHRWHAYDRMIWQLCACRERHLTRQALGEYCIREQRAGRTEIPLDEIEHVRKGIVIALEMVER